MSFHNIQKLDLKISKISIKAPKIDSSILKIFRLIIVDFYIKNKINKLRYFQ